MTDPTAPPVDPAVWAAARAALDRHIVDSPAGLASRRRVARQLGRAVAVTWMAPSRRKRFEADLASRLGDEVDPEAGARIAERWAIDVVRRHDRIPSAVRATIEPSVRRESRRIYHGGGHNAVCPSDCPCASVLGELVTDHIWSCFAKGIDDEDAVVAAWNRSLAPRRFRDQVDKIAHAEHGTSQKVRRSIFSTARMARAFAAEPCPSEEDRQLMAELVYRHVLLRLGEDDRMRSIDARMGQWASQLGIDVARAHRLHVDALRRVRHAAEGTHALQTWVDRHLDIGRLTSGDALLDGPSGDDTPRTADDAITSLGGRARDDDQDDDEAQRGMSAVDRAVARHRTGVPADRALAQAIADEYGRAAAARARASADWAALVRAVRNRGGDEGRLAS